jgi:hypothetical protein
LGLKSRSNADFYFSSGFNVGYRWHQYLSLLGNYLYKHIIYTDTYTQLANCPVNISWGGLVYYPATKKIYLLGGAPNLSGKVGSNGVYAYDISSNSWSNSLAVAPYSVYGHTRENTLYGDKIIMGYGQGLSSNFHSEIYYLIFQLIHGHIDLL